MSKIRDFYAGSGTDAAGRTLEQVWRFKPAEIETRHDFIQWLFPLREPSRYNPDAPLLAPADEDAFRRDARLQENLLRSLDMMLGFYGLRREGKEILPPDLPGLAERAWLTPGDHNHLRLSRIVQSLALLGQDGLARSLQSRLMDIARARPDRVAPRTVEVWSGLLER
jgi:hypothetical protein